MFVRKEQSVMPANKDLSMNYDDENFIDPYLKHGNRPVVLPDDLLFLCAFEISTEVDNVAVVAFARRTETRDEIWTAISVDWAGNSDVSWLQTLATAGKTRPDLDDRAILMKGCAVSIPRNGAEAGANLKMLNLLFGAHGGALLKLLYPGMLSTSDYQNLVESFAREQAEHERKNVTTAQQNITEIVKLAKDLTLAPCPSGTGPDHWQAHCPGTKHFLEIQATRNLFYCGYCRHGGSLNELCAFVSERLGPSVFTNYSRMYFTRISESDRAILMKILRKYIKEEYRKTSILADIYAVIRAAVRDGFDGMSREELNDYTQNAFSQSISRLQGRPVLKKMEA